LLNLLNLLIFFLLAQFMQLETLKPARFQAAKVKFGSQET